MRLGVKVIYHVYVCTWTINVVKAYHHSLIDRHINAKPEAVSTTYNY